MLTFGGCILKGMRFYLLIIFVASFYQIGFAQNVEDKSNLTYTIAEKMPYFEGGDEAIFKFIYSNLKFPVSAKELRLTGTVIVSFLIKDNGFLDSIKIGRPINGEILIKEKLITKEFYNKNKSLIETACNEMNEEALRIVKLMPAWIPGTEKGNPIHVWYGVPVKFKLK